MWGINGALLKVDWLAARIALRVVGAVFVIFLHCWRLHNPPANGKQGPISEKMSQTLLTIKNQRNLD
jgi:hypothetical protein